MRKYMWNNENSNNNKNSININSVNSINIEKNQQLRRDVRRMTGDICKFKSTMNPFYTEIINM